jgi:hypothetical protein
MLLAQLAKEVVMRCIGSRGFAKLCFAAALLAAFPARALTVAQVFLPQPAPGCFTTVFDFLPNGRIVAFDGFTVFVQTSIDSSNLVAIGTLPPQFAGATDPAFVAASPNGRDIVLGAGAGGSKFPDPNFNGNLFRITTAGGQATLIARFPFHIEATFLGPDDLVFGEGETFGTFTGSVELLDIHTLAHITLVGPVPGDPSGVVFDAFGNLYVGLGAGQDATRNGEIRRFSIVDLARAIFTHTPVSFDSGTFVTQVLSGGSLHFDTRKIDDLFVGDGDIFGPTGSFGFFAKVDTDTGTIVRRFEPEDNDPNGHDQAFWELAFTPVGCRLAAVDTFALASGPAPVFQMNACTEP